MITRFWAMRLGGEEVRKAMRSVINYWFFRLQEQYSMNKVVMPRTAAMNLTFVWHGVIGPAFQALCPISCVCLRVIDSWWSMELRFCPTFSYLNHADSASVGPHPTAIRWRRNSPITAGSYGNDHNESLCNLSPKTVNVIITNSTHSIGHSKDRL